MPQLDKYIFFNHVVSLTIFFSLIYIYLRKHVVPELSSVLKFRRKKLSYITNALSSFEKGLNLSKTLFEKKSKQYINLITTKSNNLIINFNELLSSQVLDIYTKNISAVKSSKLINQIYFKNKKELNRFKEQE